MEWQHGRGPKSSCSCGSVTFRFIRLVRTALAGEFERWDCVKCDAANLVPRPIDHEPIDPSLVFPDVSGV
jgi:hypothetical protein